MTKTTLTDRINAIEFETLTAEDFEFLVERALKSIRKAGTKARKETKAHKENVEKAKQVLDFVEANGAVTCAEVQEMFGVSSQKAAAILKVAGLTRVEGKGKEKATYVKA